MARFVQPLPPPEDPYAGDRFLRVWLDRQLGSAGHALAKGRLTELAADVAGPLRAAHADAEAHPPELVRYDAWGARVDRVDTSAGWQAQRAAAARHAVVALPYLDEARGTWGAGDPRVQHALLHLYGPESATFSCPVAMADGAAALLSRADVDRDVRDAVAAPAAVHRPGHRDHQRAVDDRVAGRLRPGPVLDRRPPRRRPVAAHRREVVLLGDRLRDGGRAGPARGRRRPAAGRWRRSWCPGTRRATAGPPRPA